MTLTKLERLQLVNQFRILEKLDPDNAASYKEHREALEGGFQDHYSWMLDTLSEEMSAGETHYVLDVLQMYSELLLSWEKLKNKEGLTEKSVRFPGFYGNTEVPHLSYTYYFINKLGRFPELARSDFNSHHPTREAYERMLAVWREIKEGGASDLTAVQIQAVLEAGFGHNPAA